MQLVRHKNDKKMKVSYGRFFFQKIIISAVKNINQKQNKKSTENKYDSLLYVSSERKPGWRFTARPSKDAVPASWLRSGRAAKRKIYKKMYTVDEVIIEKSIANYWKVASYYNKASVGGI